MIDKKLSIPIYDCEVRLIVADDYQEAVLEAGYKEDVPPVGAIVLHYPDTPLYYVMIFHKDSISPGNIAHESLHLLHKIMRDVSIPPRLQDDEPEAYLMGFIVDLITQATND